MKANFLAFYNKAQEQHMEQQMESSDFWIGIGDIHGDTSMLQALPDLEQAQAVIISGDLTIHGGAPEADRVIQAVAKRNPRILAQVGNMDPTEVATLLEDKQLDIHAKAMELAPAAGELPAVGLMAVGASTPTPFNTPNEVSEEQMAAWLEQAYAQAGDFSHLLLVAHDPPYNSVADILPGGHHVGSKAVRSFIDRVQPDLCLTGHIHESRGQGHIGKTLVCNPGPLAAGGYVFIRRTSQGLTAELRTMA